MSLQNRWKNYQPKSRSVKEDIPIGEEMEPEKPPVQITMTHDQLQEMMQQVIATAIKAAKELPDEEKEERAKKKKYEETAIKQAMEQAKAEEMARESRQSNCGHKKENGRWATSGQVIGGKFAMLICQHCQKTWMWEPTDPNVIAQLLAGDLVLLHAEPPYQARVSMPSPVAKEPRIEHAV